MILTSFTPWASLSGGCLIGLAAVLLMAGVGRIAGISGIVSGLLVPFSAGNFFGRLAFVSGLILAPVFVTLLTGQAPVQEIATSTGWLVVAGILVGFGSVWGGGCTSGHGVCGLARLSVRSLVAVAVFMATAILTVWLVRHGWPEGVIGAVSPVVLE